MLIINESGLYSPILSSKLQRCLRCLTETGKITDEVRPDKYRIITVKNYDIYQAAVDTSKANRNANRRTNSNTNSKANSKANSSATTKERKKVYLSPTGIDIRKTPKIRLRLPPLAAAKACPECPARRRGCICSGSCCSTA